MPAARFGTGSGVLNMGRQIGSVIGVAGLVAILGQADAADPVLPFRHGVIMIIAFFLAAALTAAGLLTRRVVAPAPAPVALGSHRAMGTGAGLKSFGYEREQS